LALVSPVLAQDEASTLADVKDSASQLQFYLASVAKSGGKADFSKPPVSDQFARVFDLKRLAALPQPKASDLTWLTEWGTAGSAVHSSILYFGITPPVDPSFDLAAIKRNMFVYEDQEAVARSFMLRVSAREITAMSLFMEKHASDPHTPMSEQRLNAARAAGARIVYEALFTIVTGQKPANARLLSAAMRDTSEVWARYIFAKDRPPILNRIADAEKATKDGEAQQNLVALGAALAAAK
jgi:hypothetical protein